MEKKKVKNELEFTEKSPNICMYFCINDKIHLDGFGGSQGK